MLLVAPLQFKVIVGGQRSHLQNLFGSIAPEPLVLFWKYSVQQQGHVETRGFSCPAPSYISCLCIELYISLMLLYPATS